MLGYNFWGTTNSSTPESDHVAPWGRVDVIDQLRKNQAGPVTLMAMVGETVNNTEAVWLDNLHDPQRALQPIARQK